MSSSRPTGITIIAAYYLIYGLASTAYGLFAGAIGTALVFCFPGVLAGGIGALATGILNLALGACVWTGKDWARWVVMILAILGILNALGAFGFYSVIHILINVAVLIYMQGKEAQHFFATN